MSTTEFMGYVEDNNILDESQNGFRKNHSTIEHVFSLCQSIKVNKVKNKLPTFACLQILQRPLIVFVR